MVVVFLCALDEEKSLHFSLSLSLSPLIYSLPLSLLSVSLSLSQSFRSPMTLFDLSPVCPGLSPEFSPGLS